MHASHNSARLAPKKANLMAKVVRGLSVPDAMELLRKTGKKSARLFEAVLRSAIANAEHNFKQDPQTMILKEVFVNQGTSYRRGIPMARGRTRPIRKYLCHISMTLGYPEAPKSKKTKAVVATDGQKVTTKKKTSKVSTSSSK